MKPKISIIGCGMGGEHALTQEAKKTIEACQLLLGAERLLQPYKTPQKACLRNEEIVRAIEAARDVERIGVLVSGDPGFFSAAKKLLTMLDLDGFDVNVICGQSALSCFCARLRISWDDAHVLSLHGRENVPLEQTVARHKKTFLLTGGENSVSAVCKRLEESGMEELAVAVGENLSYENERVEYGIPEAFIGQEWGSLSVMLVENPNAGKHSSPGIPDEAFLRGSAPMTKFEVRSVSVARLRVKPGDVVYDIGAGTGSVSVELSRYAYDGQVFAIEQKKDAITVLEQNIRRLGAYSVRVVRATAPDGLIGLPAPDKVFIGGSSGRMDDILDAVLAANPHVVVVANAITLETMQAAVQGMESRGMTVQIAQVNVSHVKERGGYHMMNAQNPVFVICGERT